MNSPFLLYTEEGCPEQTLHTDDQGSFKNIIGGNDILSNHAVVALWDIVQLKFAREYLGEGSNPKSITIPKYRKVLFCGNALHGNIFHNINRWKWWESSFRI